MLLTPQDVELFFKLNRALMSFVNQRLEVIPEDNGSTEKLAALSPDTPLKLRDAFLKHTDLIQSFVEENPVHLADDELAIVRSWQYLVPGKFYIFRELTKYTVFLSTDKQPIAYGVLALSQPFEELVPSPLPILTETVLLPFKGRIVYDGMLNTYRISFGPGIRRSLNETFKEAKEAATELSLLCRCRTTRCLRKRREPSPVRRCNPRRQRPRFCKSFFR